MIPLIACSVLAVAVTLERVIFFLVQKMHKNEKVITELFDIAEGKNDRPPENQPDADGNKDYRAKVLFSGLRHRGEGLAESMEIAAMEEIGRMKRGLSLMHTIVAVAPLLGILGTVIGIIESFDVLGQAGIEDPRAVTSGIAQALLTTAAGLSIAICTLLPYEYFAARVRRATEELSLLASRFELALKKTKNPAGRETEKRREG